MGASNHQANNLIEQNFRSATVPKPTNRYLALFAGDPDSGGVELSGNGYSRVNVPPDDANWTAMDANRRTFNVNAVDFGPASADWSQATHAAFMDADTAGNRIYTDPLDAPVTILNGQTGRFAAGTIGFTQN